MGARQDHRTVRDWDGVPSTPAHPLPTHTPFAIPPHATEDDPAVARLLDAVKRYGADSPSLPGEFARQVAAIRVEDRRQVALIVHAAFAKLRRLLAESLGEDLRVTGHMIGAEGTILMALEGAPVTVDTIATLQRLHDQAERDVRAFQRSGGVATDPRTAAHLGGRVVAIRAAMAALGATEVATDTGLRSLADERAIFERPDSATGEGSVL
jgi:hypothetical protein